MTHDFLAVAVTFANAAFTALRIAANVPQFLAILRDPGGARAISVPSWVVFGTANGCNGLYALVIAGDWATCAINGVSACSCWAIAATARIRQHRIDTAQETSRAIPNAAAAASAPIASV